MHRVLQDDSLHMQKFGYLRGHGWNMRVILSYQALAQQHFQYHRNSAETVYQEVSSHVNRTWWGGNPQAHFFLWRGVLKGFNTFPTFSTSSRMGVDLLNEFEWALLLWGDRLIIGVRLGVRLGSRLGVRLLLLCNLHHHTILYKFAYVMVNHAKRVRTGIRLHWPWPSA